MTPNWDFCLWDDSGQRLPLPRLQEWLLGWNLRAQEGKIGNRMRLKSIPGGVLGKVGPEVEGLTRKVLVEERTRKVLVEERTLIGPWVE